MCVHVLSLTRLSTVILDIDVVPRPRERGRHRARVLQPFLVPVRGTWIPSSLQAVGAGIPELGVKVGVHSAEDLTA